MDQQQVTALCGMEESLCRLIRLYGMRHPSEPEIADWFSGIEFEALRPEASCMAAAMASANDYMGTPGELIPRLRGIMKYVHTLNSGMTAGLCSVGKLYREAGIPAVLHGGTAVHLGCPDRPRRHIWHTEIHVSEADFPRAAALAEQAGFTVERTPYSATARQGNTQCILIRKGMAHTRGAAELTVSGVPFLMPCSAALLVSLSEAVFQLLSGAAPGAKLIPWIMDLHCVIGSDPDWNGAAAVAAERETAPQLRLVLELYNSLIPDTLTGEILDLFGTGAHTAQLARLLQEYRDINSGGSGWKRRWISARLRSGGSSSAALGLLFRTARQALVRKLTPER